MDYSDHISLMEYSMGIIILCVTSRVRQSVVGLLLQKISCNSCGDETSGGTLQAYLGH